TTLDVSCGVSGGGRVPFEVPQHRFSASRDMGCQPANARREVVRMVSAMDTATPTAAPSIDVATLRAGYGTPSERAVKKSLTALDRHMREFIALSPLLVLGTSSDGGADVSPRGDRPGFVHVLDDHTLLVPDWPGNNRLDSLANVVANPQ